MWKKKCKKQAHYKNLKYTKVEKAYCKGRKHEISEQKENIFIGVNLSQNAIYIFEYMCSLECKWNWNLCSDAKCKYFDTKKPYNFC